MFNSVKKCLISIQKSGKNIVHELNIMKKVLKYLCRKSPPKRGFYGFDGMKSSFASMEISRQLELVFKFIDANGDGKISPSELREFLLCLGHDKSKVAEEAARMLRHLDSNGDGFVDLHEYMDAVMMGDDGDDDSDYDYDNDGYVDDHYDHHYHHHGGFEDYDDLMDAFLVFDSDKNGLISAKELHRVLKRLGFADCSLKECKLMIKGVDKDGDGFVNFEEFKLMMMGYGNHNQQNQQKEND